MKKFFSLLAIILLTFRPGIADEGMWLLPLIQQLNMNKMKEMGLRLNAEDIYSVNHSSLKDAVVIFGSGCTGEIVSQQGLLLTNHHCGFESVQSHSSVDHDYLTNGFWAKTKAEEMPTPDLTVTFLVKIEEVTNKINAALKPGLDESDRKEIIKKVSEEIQNNAVKGTHYSAEVDDFFGGNNFYLVVYEKFLDVRFVGAPPSS
ncbi:MAG: S46 family peptidase, partial [Bacteroidota bacterium]|nr:S46 family peptidase [Bacteroidota bacterium]